VAVTVGGLDESMVACGALVRPLLAVSLLVVDHVTKFWRFDVAADTLEKLIGAACVFVDNVLLDEAHVACVITVPVAHPFFDHLAQGRVVTHGHVRSSQVGYLLLKMFGGSSVILILSHKTPVV
jgi:hypothetical protein